VVIAISSPNTTRQLVRMIRTFTETVYIIVRTRYIREMEEILKLGADEVIPEEFETSIEIFARVLNKYLIPGEQIKGYVNEIRSHNYEMLRDMVYKKPFGEPPVKLPEIEFATIHVQPEKNEIVGRSLGDSEIRKKYGVTVFAIKRGGDFITEINRDVVIRQDDILYLVGRHDEIVRINKLFTLS